MKGTTDSQSGLQTSAEKKRKLISVMEQINSCNEIIRTTKSIAVLDPKEYVQIHLQHELKKRERTSHYLDFRSLKKEIDSKREQTTSNSQNARRKYEIVI